MQIKRMVEEALAKHGLKSASQRQKLKAKLFEDMEELVGEQVCLHIFKKWTLFHSKTSFWFSFVCIDYVQLA